MATPYILNQVRDKIIETTNHIVDLEHSVPTWFGDNIHQGKNVKW